MNYKIVENVPVRARWKHYDLKALLRISMEKYI